MVAANPIELLQLLCEIEPPQIASQALNSLAERQAFQALQIAGALVEAGSADTIRCAVCDHPHFISVEYEGGGKYRAYCPDEGYQQVSADLLRMWSVAREWIPSTISSQLGLKPVKQPVDSQSDVFHIGNARFGPVRCNVFFGRMLWNKDRFEKTQRILARSVGRGPSILVTTTDLERIHGQSSPRCALVSVKDVLIIGPGKVSLEEGPFHAALRDGGPRVCSHGIGVTFSPGFRSASFGDQEYTFTDKQALVVDALYAAWVKGTPRLHQSEIQGAADTGQRVGQLFRKHPANGELIRHDSSGYYWLDL